MYFFFMFRINQIKEILKLLTVNNLIYMNITIGIQLSKYILYTYIILVGGGGVASSK